MDCQNSRTVQANNVALNPVTLHAYLHISQPLLCTNNKAKNTFQKFKLFSDCLV